MYLLLITLWTDDLTAATAVFHVYLLFTFGKGSLWYNDRICHLRAIFVSVLFEGMSFLTSFCGTPSVFPVFNTT